MSTRARLDALIAERSGIELSRGGVARSLDRFVERRTRELGLRSLEEYLPLLLRPETTEFERMLDAITVVHSWFFRDPGQLAAIEALLCETRSEREPARVWIAGCACGEDAYSIALIGERVGRAVEVLGTDVNSEALAQARLGHYGAWSTRDVEPGLARFFERSENGLRIDPIIKSKVRFERHNLLDAPPTPLSGGAWDIILCRNVLIYFVPEKARRVFERQASALAPGGHLLLGASEIVFDVPFELEARYLAGRLTFRRRAAARCASAPACGCASSAPAGSSSSSAPAGTSSSAPARGSTSSTPASAPLPGALRSSKPPISSPALGVARRATGGALSDDPPIAAQRPRGGTDPLARGHEFLNQGDPRSARDAYLELVERDATFAEARMYAGVAHYLSDEVSLALHELRGALFLDGSLWPAAFYLALVYESLGLPEDAQREYRNVIRLSEREGAIAPSSFVALSAWHGDLLALAHARVSRASRHRRLSVPGDTSASQSGR